MSLIKSNIKEAIMDTSSFETILPVIIGAIGGAIGGEALYCVILKPAFLYWLNKYKD
jgi:hypothetical protein